MASHHTIRRTVEFSETDMAGIMHYSNFFRYMETAEHAFFRSIGFSVSARAGAPQVGWPRVHATCDYHRPLRFEDVVEVRMQVLEKRSRALTYGFTFFKVVEGTAAEKVAEGRLTVVCVAHRPDGTMKSVDIPQEIGALIDVGTPEPGDG